jgi:hypothetical protein
VPAVQAAFEDKTPGARQTALGGAFVALADDAQSVYYNPSGLAFINQWQASFTHTALFSISDLAYDWAGLVMPVYGKGAGAVSYSQFGPSIYKEQEISVGSGYMITPRAGVGISINYLRLTIADYGSCADWSGTIGFLALVAPSIWAGMSGRNIIATHLGATDEMPEKTASCGVRFEPKNYLRTLIDVSRDSNARQFTCRVGQEIVFMDIIAMRFGFHNYPDRFSGGFGIRWEGIHVDYAIVTHSRLGLQQQFSMSMEWK